MDACPRKISLMLCMYSIKWKAFTRDYIFYLFKISRQTLLNNGHISGLSHHELLYYALSASTFSEKDYTILAILAG